MIRGVVIDALELEIIIYIPREGYCLYLAYYGCATWEGEFEKILPYIRHLRTLLKGGVSNFKMAHPYTKIREEPPPIPSRWHWVGKTMAGMSEMDGNQSDNSLWVILHFMSCVTQKVVFKLLSLSMLSLSLSVYRSKRRVVSKINHLHFVWW